MAQIPRGTASARMLLATACEHGMSVADCLRDTALTADLLADPGQEILASQEERLIGNIVARFGDNPAIGLAAGSSYRLPTFGMFGLALMSAETPRQTIQVSLRVQDLSATLARARWSDSAKFGYMTLDTSHLAPEIHAFVIDHCLAAIWVPLVALDGPANRDCGTDPQPTDRHRAVSQHVRARAAIQPAHGSHRLLPRLPRSPPTASRSARAASVRGTMPSPDRAPTGPDRHLRPSPRTTSPLVSYLAINEQRRRRAHDVGPYPDTTAHS